MVTDYRLNVLTSKSDSVLAAQNQSGAARMQVIAVASQKGGAGKSTLCAHLGVLADRTDLASRSTLMPREA